MPSTVIAHMNYDTEKETLTITFVSGEVYEYRQVPADVFAAMKAARSKGTYLNRHIKGHFEFGRITPVKKS
jgi:hypothetical protein